MVTLFYPAVRGTGRPAPYMDIAEATALVDFGQLGPEFTAKRLAGTAPIALNRATDLSFVLDKLSHNPLVDERRVAVVGHPMGGDAAATAMRADARVDAGINIDGPMLPADPLGRPFLLFGTLDDHHPGGDFDPSWDAVWPKMSGWRRWLTVTDADHYSFTDLDLLVQQSGVDLPFLLDPARGIQLTRAYVGAFLDQHLRGIPQRLLAGPTAAFPEVTFQRSQG